MGAGDSTTVLVTTEMVVQVDINHLESAEDEDDPRYPMVDELVELLPRVDGRPYLAAYVATHADEDHCRGFRELIEDRKVLIGELWFTPRLVAEIDAEDPDDLSDDAKALRDEALRRIGLNKTKKASPLSGNRIRVVGYHDSLEGDFADLDDDLITAPGGIVDTIDGTYLGANLRIFVHSPFKDDMEGSERNRTSIGMHVSLYDGIGRGRALLLGDLDYEPVKRLLEYTESRENKEWDVFLAPHHCSKSVMYEREEGKDVLRSDVLELIEDAKSDMGWVVSSSGPVPSSNSAGDNPPHAKAKNRYSERCDAFLCTGEHPNTENPEPLVFEVSQEGIAFLGTLPDGSTGAEEQINKARGGDEPVVDSVGFGAC